MADKFDPYREALVMEIETHWPEEYSHLSEAEKRQLEVALHADPSECAQLEYVRVHTGFCRSITPSVEDIERVQAALA